MDLFLAELELGGSALCTVSELTAQIREILEQGFGEVAVAGEISNLARPRSGHLYFSLKDERASLRAVLWKSAAARIPFDLSDGLAVRAYGELTVYEPRGEYQLVVREIEPEGVGALELAFRQLVERLGAEGLFEPTRKRPLPRYPRRIALVTSPSGAAVQDMLQVLARRWPCGDVIVVPARVQGAGAAEEIAAGIRLANTLEGAEVIVTGRGGGSLEDLWPFNEEIVARAIFGSRLPVISAVGHEVDVTIADLVADRRALTPTEAAEICAPDVREVRGLLDGYRERLGRAILDQAREARTEIDTLGQRLKTAVGRRIEERRHALGRLASALDALSPLAVLGRGYSLTQREEDGALLRSADQVRPGQTIRTRLASGSLVSRVESVRSEKIGTNGAESAPMPPKRTRTRRARTAGSPETSAPEKGTGKRDTDSNSGE